MKARSVFDEELRKRLKDPEVREVVAELCHDQWSNWMYHLFSKCEKRGTGKSRELVIPAQAVERWQRQMALKYEELLPAEKQSDRNEAGKFVVTFAELLGDP